MESEDWIKWMETASVIFLYWMPTLFFDGIQKMSSEIEREKNWDWIQIDHDLCNALLHWIEC